MYEGIDTVVLYEELAYEDVLPVTWRRLTEPFDASLLNSFAERNLRVLQTLAALEDAPVEKSDDHSPHAVEIARLDLKVNLLLDMVGQLLSASRPRPKSLPIRFNALGAVWHSAPPHPEMGSEGVLEIYLRDCIAEPLRLVGRIATVGPDGRIKARIVPPGENIADLLEKLAFRKHRRQIAGTKAPRKG